MNPIQKLERIIGETTWEDESEKEYHALLLRLVKGADYLGNPLIRPDDYAKGIKLYDVLCRKITEMRRLYHD